MSCYYKTLHGYNQATFVVLYMLSELYLPVNLISDMRTSPGQTIKNWH